MQHAARVEAQKQWNNTACGEVSGNKDTVEYFLQVERERYRQQGWAADYFGYDKFNAKKVLEIGVGQGTDLIQFAKAGAECYGVDITDNHLLLAEKNFQLRGQKVVLKKADATQLPFTNDYFDCIYSFGVIHHIPEAQKVLDEAYRVLKPGGQIMLAIYYKWSAFHLFSKLFYNGLCRGWLFTKGYDGLLATIEQGADGVHIKPYVKLYSKKEMRDLMKKQYCIEDVSIHQIDVSDFCCPNFLVSNGIKRSVSSLESILGWYVTCKARKPPRNSL